MKNKYSILVIPFFLAIILGVFINTLDLKETGNKEVAKETEGKTEEVASIDGEAIYKQSCISCHGDQYQGAVGPTLKGLSGKYEKGEVEEILKNGKGGMPSGLVSSEDAPAMAEWLLSLE